MSRLLPLLGLLALLAACGQYSMANQKKYESYEQAALFPDDGGGTDTYDFSNYTTGVSVSLQPGGWTTTSTAQLANLGAGHTAIGNIANAYLYHNNPA